MYTCNLRRPRQQRGFTLPEILLVSAILSILVVVGAPLYESFQNSTGMNVSTNILAQYLYQAQIYSRSEENDSNWGVAISGQMITLFAGSSYATRNAVYDTTYTFPITIVSSGLSQVVFNKLTGLPQATGSFVITNSNLTSTITINPKGMVDY